jgi:hypothetical protein
MRQTGRTSGSNRSRPHGRQSATIDIPDVEAVLMQETENHHPLRLDKRPLAYWLKGYRRSVGLRVGASRGSIPPSGRTSHEHLLADSQAIHKR